MSAAAENFKATAIANLKEEAAMEGWEVTSEEYKSKFRAIIAAANGMAQVAAPVAEPAKAKRMDPPWETSADEFSSKNWDSIFQHLQQLEKGKWTRDRPHFGYRLDDEKNKRNTKRWVSPKGKMLVRVTELQAPGDLGLGKYEIQTSPSNYREAIIANKKAKEDEKKAKRAAREAKKEAKAAKKEAKAEKLANKKDEKDEGEGEGEDEGEGEGKGQYRL